LNLLGSGSWNDTLFDPADTLTLDTCPVDTCTALLALVGSLEALRRSYRVRRCAVSNLIARALKSQLLENRIKSTSHAACCATVVIRA